MGKNSLIPMVGYVPLSRGTPLTAILRILISNLFVKRSIQEILRVSEVINISNLPQVLLWDQLRESDFE